MIKIMERPSLILVIDIIKIRKSGWNSTTQLEILAYIIDEVVTESGSSGNRRSNGSLIGDVGRLEN